VRVARGNRAPSLGTILLVLAVVTGTLPACGRKGAPLAPELVRPLAPAELRAVRVAEGIRLSWRRPTRTTGGRSLEHLERFLIERARGEEALQLVHTVVVEDQERFRPVSRFDWLDTEPAPDERVRYRVVAVTRGGVRGLPAGPVEVSTDGSPAQP